METYDDKGKMPFVVDVEKLTLDNNNYRTTIWTGKKLQMTVMTIEPGDDIGLEVHPETDQFLRIEQGSGICKMGPTQDNLNFVQEVKEDFAIFVPANTWHDVINTGNVPLKLYTLYAGPDHLKGAIHKTHQDAIDDPNEH